MYIPSTIRELILISEDQRNGFADTFIFEPETTREKKLGILLIVAEIAKPGKHASQIVNGIAELMQYEYYQNSEDTILKNFEASLKKVNETLSELAENGITSWIGKLNATIAVISENELHVATTGKANAYLVRSGEIASIKAKHFPTDAERENPLKTFTNVASGRLYNDDKIIVTTPALTEYLSSEKILRTFENMSAKKAVESFTEILSSYKEETNVASLFISLGQEDEEEQATPVPPTIDPELSEEIKPVSEEPSILDEAAPMPEIKEPEHKTETVAKIKSLPGKIFSSQTKEGIIAFGKKTSEKSKRAFSAILSKIPKKQSSPVEKTEPSHEDLAAKRRSQGGFKKIMISTYDKLKSKVISPLFNWFMGLKKSSRLFLVAAVVLAIILIISISVAIARSKEQKVENTDIPAILKEVEELNNKGNAELVFGKKNEALKYFSEAEEKANNVLSKDPNNENAKSLLADIKDGLDRSSNKSTVTLETVSNLKDFAGNDINANHIKKIGSELYAINSADNSIIEYSTSSEKGRVLSIPQKATPLLLGIMGDSIIGLTSTPSLIQNSTEGFKSIKSEFSDNSFVNLSAIGSYGEKIYGLMPSKDMVYMFVKGELGYSEGERWLKNTDTSLDNAIDFAIDGAIYVLKSDNSIVKFMRGEEEKFDTKDMPSGDKYTEIQTSENSNLIYLLSTETKSIVAIDKSGNFKNSYKWNEDGVKSMFVDESAKTIYLLTDTEIRSFDL